MSSFNFKQFSIIQNKTAMKVGTDSILLGSWVGVNNIESVLDIGTGTGVLALMIAQRSEAEIIDAVEIDADAYIESVTNFENSPWGDRLFSYHISIQEFAEEIDDKYSLIIANPPYFNPHNIKSVTQKSIARQTHLLNHLSLLKTTKKLLDTKGYCAFIIPFEIESFFIDLASNLGLHIQKITRTKDTKNTAYSRSLVQFGFQKINLETTEVILKNEDKTYTKEFIELTKDFYLKNKLQN